MIYGSKWLINMVEKDKLVQGLSSRERKNPEGPGFDLRAREFYILKGQGCLGLRKRKTPQAQVVASVNKDKEITLQPGDYYLVKTMEKVNMPERVFAQVFARSTLFRSGIQLQTGKISPKYYGELTFGIINLSKKPFKIELGSRIAFIVFSQIQGSVNPSRGQWLGGRVDASQPENQV
ncbi:MAG: hypothetical protein GF332_00275 [Candidatus Moranbacteria bacterium]|nr:hypothetical protein [Candidatus Moranbacteria bacterium]